MDDGNHPTKQGSYLAALVLYYTLSGTSPAGNTYHSSLDTIDAWYLQAIAAETVEEEGTPLP